MIFFARETRYVTAINKMLFWLAISASILLGLLFCGAYQVQKPLPFTPLRLMMGLSLLLCAADMMILMNGFRQGGYAAFVALIVFVLSGLLSLSTQDRLGEVILGMAGIVLWPTLETLFGVKRKSFAGIHLKREMLLRGSILGKVLFGLGYLLALATLVLAVLSLR